MVDITSYAAVVQGHAKSTVSDKYTFIPTTRVIDLMEQRGWYPAKVQQAYAKPENRGFQKHMVRFRQSREDSVVAIDKVVPEIVVTNSHGGASSFELMAGLFRFICLNGMVVADSTFAKHRVTHLGFADVLVMDAVDQMMDTVPKIAGRVKDFQQIEMDKDEQNVFAMASLLVKYGEEEVERRKFDPAYLLAPVRREDSSPTLWATYNRVQEKLVNGGRFERAARGRTVLKSRKVSSVTEDVRINQGLWLLTERMAGMKGATIQ